MSTRTFSTGLCPDCSCKLNYRSEKREVKRLKRQKKKRKDRSSPNESVEENIEAEPESVEEPSTSTSTVEVPEKEESLWRKGSYRILPCASHISIVILHGDSGNKRPLLQDNISLSATFCLVDKVKASMSCNGELSLRTNVQLGMSYLDLNLIKKKDLTFCMFVMDKL